ncbi:DUF433 domain-containing protein [Rhodopseudomonas palustris]|uniref:DUF433 domain-containing protein n=1 Tax=Rhodopseudomonas palustris (strain BisB18) TaxID=316056 RepID=Q214Y6_RHOPB
MTLAQDRIVIDPAVLGGQPVIRGTTITVESVIGLMADGWKEPDILAKHPALAPADIAACLSYARDLVHAKKVFPEA